MDKNLQIAEEVLKAVGGKENVTSVAHCVTRLRFNLKDESLVNEEEIKKIPGVMGVAKSAGLFMVIIGQNVEQVYSHLCGIGGFKATEGIDENLDGELGVKKLTFKGVFEKIMNYISGTMVGVLPIIIGAAMCKTIGIVLGPTILNVISEESDTYYLFNFLYNACFYFLPIFLGYTAAKQLNTNIILGMFIGAMIIVPEFVGLVGVRETFSVFGINVPVASYAQTFLPVVLGVWVMSYVYKLLKKYIPNVLSSLLVPTLTIIIMAPIMFAVCAPIGNWIGNAISSLFSAIGNANIVVKVIAAAIAGMILPFVVLMGMHTAIYISAYVSFIGLGKESWLMPLSATTSFAMYGLALGALLKMKTKEAKGNATAALLSGILAGLSEPTLYGVVIKYRKTMVKVIMFVGAVTGALAIILGLDVYIFGGTMNIFSLATYFAAGGVGNLVRGIIGCVASFLFGAAITYFFGDFEND